VTEMLGSVCALPRGLLWRWWCRIISRSEVIVFINIFGNFWILPHIFLYLALSACA
jgi:hypothetical protein